MSEIKNSVDFPVNEFYRDGIKVMEYTLTDSTNKRARIYAEKEDATVPALFIAKEQTAGRGRLGRSFFSPAQSGVYMTLLLKAPKNAESFAKITSLCAVAVLDSIYGMFGITLDIKWVNDLYLNTKKCAGILAESFEVNGCRYVAIGIGINLFCVDFPEDLRTKAGSILTYPYCYKEEQDTQKKELAFSIAKGIIDALDAEDTSQYMYRYRQRSCVIGKRISFSVGGVTQRGKAVGITDMGALEVVFENGEKQELSTGEISVFIEEKGEDI